MKIVPLRIGISACLLGYKVRYDGGHKRAPFLAGMGRRAEFVPVCPEVEMGLGTPRDPIQLARGRRGVRLTAVDGGRDLTARMRKYAAGKMVDLKRLRLSGFIFKEGSPSCGIEGVKVHGSGGLPARRGPGLFAEALMKEFPGMPVEDEENLRDHALRDSFFKKVLQYHRREGSF